MHDVSSIPTVAPLRELGTPQILFPRTTVECRDVFGYSNAQGAALAGTKASMRGEVVDVPAVELVRLPAGARVFGQSWRLLVGERLADEQLLYRKPGPPTDDLLTLPPSSNIHQIDGDVVLIARFGDGTWGHWLGELLPKIAVCERLFPGRFDFALPAWVLRTSVLGVRMIESIEFYGVDRSRIIRMGSNDEFHFSSLFGLTPVLKHRELHPEVLAILRGGAAEDLAGVPAVALRRGDPRRGIVNSNDVFDVLAKRGFEGRDIAAMAFADQVKMFKSATSVFSVLGSSLTGLLYSPPNCGVVAAAPLGFADGFFTGLLRQNENACFCNVLGEIAVENTQIKRDSSFVVPIYALHQALDVVKAFHERSNRSE